jgi:hypothetical protein
MQQTNLQAQVRSESIAVDKGSAANVTVSPDLNAPAGASGASSGPGGETSGKASSGGKEITELSTLTSASNPESLYGQKAQFSDAKVQKVWGPQLFTISGEGGQPVFVHLRQPSTDLKEGDSIKLTGTIKQFSPDKNLAEGLSADVSEKLMQQKFFLDAENMQMNK